MAIKIYSTLSRKKEELKPLEEGKIKLFVCGPTVYDFIHVGNAKTYAQFDVIAKYLKYKGFEVFYLQNITDIDDKIIKRANEEGKDWKEITTQFEKAYLEDMKHLGVNAVKKYARATDYIPEIISQVKRLIEKGFAYKISDGYYFDLKKDEEYGKLAKRNIGEEGDAVSRIDENDEKRNKGDFCLWKFQKKGEPSWESELGEGRPGWHIEDTAITEKELGPQYDIHGGGLDLIFPHHEAEIAQMESLSGKKPLVKYWMHTGFLRMNKEKMSKSLGNFSTLRGVLEEYAPEVLRYLFLSTHYRKPIDFSKEALENAKTSYQRMKNICDTLHDDGPENKEVLQEFEEAMDDDLNMPNALQAVWKLLRDESAQGKRKTIEKIDQIFGLHLFEKIEVPKKIEMLVIKREEARKKKDWGVADQLRKEILSLGFILDDTSDGVVIKKAK